jgi:aryl sulfotransferase
VSGSLVWLASYPKSGNTWVRAIVTAYRTDAPVDLAALDSDAVLGREDVDVLAGIDTADLPPTVQVSLIPCIYRAHAARLAGVTWAKTHECRTVGGQPLHPADVTHGAVYIVRDPRDVAVSYADHLRISLDAAISRLNDPDLVVAHAGPRWNPQRPQPVGRWSDHVTGWVDSDLAPVVVRYEDLIADTQRAATSVLATSWVEVDAGRLARPVAAAGFDALAAAEEAHGFHERPPGVDRFFRSGRAGAWREHLTPTQARRIVDDHGAVMERFGYDTADD